jgi:membrane protein required for colicin V production
MTPLIFDIIVVALMFLSAVIGFIRGFTHEIFTVVGWVTAALATLYLTPLAAPFLRGIFAHQIVADLTTAAIIFIITLGFFTVVSYYAGRSLRDSHLSIVDQTLGFGFGVLRGVILIALAFLLFAWMWEDADDQPDWFAKAHTRPAIEVSALWLQRVIPHAPEIQQQLKKDGMKKSIDSLLPQYDEDGNKMEKEQDSGDKDSGDTDSTNSDDSTGYEADDRQSLDQLIKQKAN